MAKKIAVAEHVTAQIEVCGESQKQIAVEVGFPKANIIRMKKRFTKLPISRANALADSLGVNRAKFMRMVLAEHQPEVLEAIEGSFGDIVPEKG